MAVEASLHYWQKLPDQLSDSEKKALPTAAALLNIKATEEAEMRIRLAQLQFGSTVGAMFGGGKQNNSSVQRVKAVKDTRREDMGLG